MSSHREAPEISKDPAADNTDTYAFIDPVDPTKVNLIADFNPFEIPFGGPNFSEFDDSVVYALNVSNRGTGARDISYLFEFTTTIRNKNTFLYNTAPIKSITDSSWNRPQTFKVTKVVRDANQRVVSQTVLGQNLLVPPCNVGERSTPNYADTFESAAVQNLGTGRKVFAGQRSDPFFVDLGSVFDLGGLRPLNQAHEIPLAKMDGVNGLQGLNVHTIALQVPIEEIQKYGHIPTDAASPNAVVGVWASTHRPRSRVFNPNTGTWTYMGGYSQVSRLGSPLFNELINPMSVKDRWNTLQPYYDKEFAAYVNKPELGALLPVLYPGAFPNLAAFNKSGKPRSDLAAIFLTGIPSAVFKGAFGTYTGSTQAEMLRLNLAVKPTAQGSENEMGVLGGDNAGFPNGRRVLDNVTKIELQAVAGATIKLVYPDYTPDTVVSSVTDGTSNTNAALLNVFPYVAPPANGYLSMPGTPQVS